MLKLFFCYRLNNLEQNNPQKAGFESNNPTRVDDAITRYNDIDKANFKEDAQDQINLLPSTLPQGDTGQTLQQIFNARLTTQDTKEHFASVRSEVLTLLGEHTKATSAINDLPHQGNRSALANELLKADTVQKVTEILAKVTPLREKIQQAQDKLSGTSENPGVSQQNATGLQDELNAADTLEKANEVLEKIEAALAKDEQDRQYAQSQTNGTNALNELPEGSRALFQEQLNNARTKKETEAVIVKIQAFKQEQDTTRQTIETNITSINNRAKLIEDLNNVQRIEDFEAIKQRQQTLVSKIEEVKAKIEAVPGVTEGTNWDRLFRRDFNTSVASVKTKLREYLDNARELENNNLSEFEELITLTQKKIDFVNLSVVNSNEYFRGDIGMASTFINKIVEAKTNDEIEAIKAKIPAAKQALSRFWQSTDLREYRDRYSNQNNVNLYVDNIKYGDYNFLLRQLYSSIEPNDINNVVDIIVPQYRGNTEYWQEAKNIVSTTAKNTFNQRMVALTTKQDILNLKTEVIQYKTKETELTSKINAFNSDSKKAHFNDLLNNATNKARVEEIIRAIEEINTKVNETNQSNDILEDQELKAQFSTRINDATSVEQLEQIVSEIQTAKQNWTTKKQEATAAKDTLTQENQKQHYEQQITSATSTSRLNAIITEIEQIKTKNQYNLSLYNEYKRVRSSLTDKHNQVKTLLDNADTLEKINNFETEYKKVRYTDKTSVKSINGFPQNPNVNLIIDFDFEKKSPKDTSKRIYFVFEENDTNRLIPLNFHTTFYDNSGYYAFNAIYQSGGFIKGKTYKIKSIYNSDGEFEIKSGLDKVFNA